MTAPPHAEDHQIVRMTARAGRYSLDDARQEWFPGVQALVLGMPLPAFIRARIMASGRQDHFHVVEEGHLRLSDAGLDWEHKYAQSCGMPAFTAALHVCSCGERMCYCTNALCTRYEHAGEPGILITRVWCRDDHDKPYPLPGLFMPLVELERAGCERDARVPQEHGGTLEDLPEDAEWTAQPGLDALVGGEARALAQAQLDFLDERMRLFMAEANRERTSEETREAELLRLERRSAPRRRREGGVEREGAAALLQLLRDPSSRPPQDPAEEPPES